jgi:bla regulator protein BlaR1
MYLLSANDLFSGKIVQALCWMLVHSLWIGLILTVVTGLIILFTKKQSSHLRYNLLTGALLLFTAAMVTIFLLQLSSSPLQQQANVLPTGPAVIITNTPILEPAAITPGFTVSVVDFFNRYAGLIVMAWFFIIAFRCIRLATGLYRIYQIKHDQLSSPGDHWNNRLSLLSKQLNIKIRVQFFQSGIAKIPMVVGHFKPIILFPIGVLTSLPQDEIEAILIHELAHIRRKDYLVNMIQSFVEILFFFNPAVLWVSSLIKIERENCCDDIAVAQTSSKRNYINALVSFQEYNLGTTKYATALTGKKDHLLQRVKRMLNNNNKTLNAMEKTLLLLCLIITTSLSVIFSQAQSTRSKSAVTATAKDSIPSLANRHFDSKDIKEGASLAYTEKVNGVSHTLYVFKRNGVLYEIYGDVTSFKIDGKAIPREQWGQYRELMDQLIADYDQSRIKEPVEESEVATPGHPVTMEGISTVKNIITYFGEGYKIVTEKNEIKAVYLQKDGSRLPDDLIKKNKELLLNIIAEQKANAKRGEAERLSKLDALHAEQNNNLQNQINKMLFLIKNETILNKDIKVIQDKSIKVANAAKVISDQSKKVAVDNKSHIKSGISYTVNGKLAYDAKYENSYSNTYKDYSPSYKNNVIVHDGPTIMKTFDLEKLTDDFINDLTKEKIISSKDGLSYNMSNEALIVNGKVQPEEIHKKFKEKYIKSPDWKLLYNWRN